MKFSLLGAVMLFSTLLLGQGDPNATPNVFHADGTFASLSAFNNGASVFLNVSRGSNSFTGGQSTFLFYDSFSSTPDGFVSTFGSGQIPSDSLTGGNPAHLVLNVDTSQLTSFFTTTCTFSFSNFTFTCTSGPGGLINIEWKQDGNFSFHSVATTQQSFFQFTIQSHGESDSGSATANGSVVGIPLNDASGSAGTNRSVTISLFKNN